ncbi:GAF and ANTAR domain-containing protein [Actinoplanes sp. NPDC026623]|uniref:GAF and ANTAR domain-containing protein n=1 Tax=Actinoplanes sp. NPDC026623 TaxID=3155610 RepID=UPI0033E59876
MTDQPADSLRTFAEIGQIKFSETDLNGVFERVAELARRSLPGADAAAVTIVNEFVSRTVATGERARRLEEWQHERRQGPSVDAAAGNLPVVIDDAAEETRWAEWAAYAAAVGVRAALSVGLPIHDSISGALTVYSETPSAFEGESVALAQTLAGYAAVALANAHLYDTTLGLAEHLRKAMEHRAVIEQAKGIIMGERRCTADEAFAILTKISQDSNRKLRDVAAALVAKASGHDE